MACVLIVATSCGGHTPSKAVGTYCRLERTGDGRTQTIGNVWVIWDDGSTTRLFHKPDSVVPEDPKHPVSRSVECVPGENP